MNWLSDSHTVSLAKQNLCIDYILMHVTVLCWKLSRTDLHTGVWVLLILVQYYINIKWNRVSFSNETAYWTTFLQLILSHSVGLRTPFVAVSSRELGVWLQGCKILAIFNFSKIQWKLTLSCFNWALKGLFPLLLNTSLFELLNKHLRILFSLGKSHCTDFK